MVYSSDRKLIDAIRARMFQLGAAWVIIAVEGYDTLKGRALEEPGGRVVAVDGQSARSDVPRCLH